MNELSHHTPAQPKAEHGTMRSYIIGFLLSLVFTAIPYYMVVNKTIAGTALLAMIVVVAVLQMAIQVLFFLHLGRGPKPLYNVTFFVFTIGTVLVVVAGSIFIMNNLHYNMTPSEATTKLAQDERIAQVGGEKTGACQEIHANHRVTISSGRVSPLYTEAGICDTLTFINEDNTLRDIAFGPHPQHNGYGGESEVTVRKGYPKTINLNQSGTYSFHDHLDPSVSGSLAVTP
ncbi:MAG TPA: cytochrome o ubiquinol oxidase subunit IV [Candidatus Limnocylindrales bacterium]|nr:cytochrome o ubiquinol oxidase subunit IV [Candidatus Limnocylindrales bacterium]